MSCDFAVFAAEIEQRLSLVQFRVFHFPDKNRMVAGDMRRHHFATHLEQRALDHRSAAGRPPKMNAQPLLGFRVVFAFRKIFGDGLLILFQDADAKLPFLLQQRVHVCAVVDAHKNEHGMKRNGSERVGGHAVNLAGLALDGNDGDAGCEMAQGFAEFS